MNDISDISIVKNMLEKHLPDSENKYNSPIKTQEDLNNYIMYLIKAAIDGIDKNTRSGLLNIDGVKKLLENKAITLSTEQKEALVAYAKIAQMRRNTADLINNLNQVTNDKTAIEELSQQLREIKTEGGFKKIEEEFKKIQQSCIKEAANAMRKLPSDEARKIIYTEAMSVINSATLLSDEEKKPLASVLVIPKHTGPGTR